MPSAKSYKLLTGFTLVELLISLAILGIIAIFTIPKLVQAQQSQQYSAMAKEAAATLSDALLQYKMSVGITPGVSTASDLYQYINYAKWDTSSQIDTYPFFSGPVTCSADSPCIRLHNGSVLIANNKDWYATNTTDAISFTFDPDGTYTGQNDSIDLSLYYDGAVRSRTYLKNNTEYGNGAIRGPSANGDPSWFQW